MFQKLQTLKVERQVTGHRSPSTFAEGAINFDNAYTIMILQVLDFDTIQAYFFRFPRPHIWYDLLEVDYKSPRKSKNLPLYIFKTHNHFELNVLPVESHSIAPSGQLQDPKGVNYSVD